MKKYKVWWSPQALDDIKQIYDYIYEQSPKGADTVFDTLLNLGDSLETLPERFPIEPKSFDHTHTYRFIPKWNYKILYRINFDAELVIIAQILSTKQNPDNFQV